MVIMKLTHTVTWYGGESERVAILEDRTHRDYGFQYGTMHVWTVGPDYFGNSDEHGGHSRWISFGHYNATGIESLAGEASVMLGERMTLVSGPETIGVQGIPTVLVARAARLSRAMPSGYGHGEWVRRGWKMRYWATDVSRERYRKAMISDICE